MHGNQMIWVVQPPRERTMAFGPFFKRSRAVRVHRHDRGVQLHHFQPDAHEPLLLQD